MTVLYVLKLNLFACKLVGETFECSPDYFVGRRRIRLTECVWMVPGTEG